MKSRFQVSILLPSNTKTALTRDESLPWWAARKKGELTVPSPGPKQDTSPNQNPVFTIAYLFKTLGIKQQSLTLPQMLCLSDRSPALGFYIGQSEELPNKCCQGHPCLLRSPTVPFLVSIKTGVALLEVWRLAFCKSTSCHPGKGLGIASQVNLLVSRQIDSTVLTYRQIVARGRGCRSCGPCHICTAPGERAGIDLVWKPKHRTSYYLPPTIFF